MLTYGSGLRSGNAMGIKPLLEVRLGPGLVQPVTRVGSSLASLLSDGLVARAGLLEKGITLAGLGNCDKVSIHNPKL